MSPAPERSAETDPTSPWNALEVQTGPPGPGIDPTRAAFASLIDVVRSFQDTVAGSAPPPEVSAAVQRELARMTALLEPHVAGEERQLFNRVPEVVGEAQTLTPSLVIDESSADAVRGRVTFGRFHLGGGWAAHGGAIALMFDTLLGRLAVSSGRSRARTAYLNMDYRHITPLETELSFEGRFVREEGRKRFLVGTLSDGDVLCAEAHGLFVELLPGQR